MVALTPNFAAPNEDEGIHHTEENTQVFMGDRDMGSGTVYISESRVSWRKGDGEGLTLEYPSISLHAVSRDVTSFPHQCLYLMIERSPEEAAEDSGSDSDENDPQIQPTEVRLVPQDNAKLDAMFNAMSDCQQLHPDPEEDEYSGDEFLIDGAGDGTGDEFYNDDSGLNSLTTQGQATLERLERMLGGSVQFRQENGTGDNAPNGVQPQNSDSTEMADTEQDADDGNMDVAGDQFADAD